MPIAKSVARPCVFGGLWAVFTGFIFFNSFQTGTTSGGMSNSVAKLIANIFTALGGTVDIDILEGFVRKAAHFTEFFIMGLLLCLCFYYGVSKLSFASHAGTMLFMLLAAAVTDEFIQSFVAGRSSEVKDVILDFCGGLTAFVIILLISKRQSKWKGKYSRR